MPVTARLSGKFYEQFGDEITNELVDWFNAVDSTYQTQLKEVNDLNWARMQARFDAFDARLDAFEAKMIGRVDAFEVKIEARLERFTRLSASSWQVQSQAAPNNHALCDQRSAVRDAVSFVVVSSYPLP